MSSQRHNKTILKLQLKNLEKIEENMKISSKVKSSNLHADMETLRSLCFRVNKLDRHILVKPWASLNSCDNGFVQDF